MVGFGFELGIHKVAAGSTTEQEHWKGPIAQGFYMSYLPALICLAIATWLESTPKSMMSAVAN